ncbi:Fpg/Nei family DNA glycosylase [Mycobacterium sp. 1165178.9]|uniref:Fpg/Nei family DNA glycosylase n=1 Tax=Mycobacterium sp. 1165178.9 TaxID=1834070 RepID=UPI0007FD1ED5|nr:DNA-formamidopyrimidine glycosylase family protein [Mycobacterium sp. 1165178.9]OBK76838.1 formamidopyrimidine-DNA glycosylase [Mycobacterium sp. 1165178.9]
MPELPDVEGFRRELAKTLPRRRIQHVDVRDPGILRNASATALARRLVGHRFEAPRRHGKWLILPTDGPTLLIHSGMTGHPYYANADNEPEKYERLVVSLDQGELRYADLRKLRGVWLAADDAELAELLGAQGPDALGMDLREFRNVIAGRRKGARQLKPTLMDQSVIAGLGNLLVDEICWRARIRPTLPVAELDDDAVKHLHRAMTQVLHTAVRHGRVPGLSRWLTGARDDPDPHCPRCGTQLCQGRIGGRMSFWCPRCQS